ncbi:OsmC family protein [Variovorax sp. J2P1-59]|uniref:OsmC family protein n=1 Tax=Variovorax flavidus TaxID=3053501 RepID=UPI00257785F1|nr:OsmC family protein [Variovorax sp. J2P1-59]MDM0074517.1 OsmC family protein [Variovorax sp. J2P1-59]
MAAADIAAACQRVESVLQRRPEAGLHDDAPATARWSDGLRVVSSHANGTQIETDMPAEVGGSGDRVSPGWMLRAGWASCTATCIAMAAAAKGIELTSLEVRASSRSDLRGLLGMAGPDDEPVYAGPRDMQMHVRISARGVAADLLRALVEESYRSSPMACAVQDALPVSLHVDANAD